MSFCVLDGEIFNVTDESKYYLRDSSDPFNRTVSHRRRDHFWSKLPTAEREAIMTRAKNSVEQHMIECEADRIAGNPMLLDTIPGLAAWDAPERIVVYCEAYLNDPNPPVSIMRLKGALAYAHERLKADAI